MERDKLLSCACHFCGWDDNMEEKNRREVS